MADKIDYTQYVVNMMPDMRVQYGPFKTAEQAVKWATKRLPTGNGWSVKPLLNPNPKR